MTEYEKSWNELKDFVLSSFGIPKEMLVGHTNQMTIAPDQKAVLLCFKNMEWMTDELAQMVLQLPVPNEKENWTQLLTKVQSDWLLYGQFYLYVLRDFRNDRKATDVERLDPTKVTIEQYKSKTSPITIYRYEYMEDRHIHISEPYMYYLSNTDEPTIVENK